MFNAKPSASVMSIFHLLGMTLSIVHREGLYPRNVGTLWRITQDLTEYVFVTVGEVGTRIFGHVVVDGLEEAGGGVQPT
jgi:hypothetical protein